MHCRTSRCFVRLPLDLHASSIRLPTSARQACTFTHSIGTAPVCTAVRWGVRYPRSVAPARRALAVEAIAPSPPQTLPFGPLDRCPSCPRLLTISCLLRCPGCSLRSPGTVHTAIRPVRPGAIDGGDQLHFDSCLPFKRPSTTPELSLQLYLLHVLVRGGGELLCPGHCFHIHDIALFVRPYRQPDTSVLTFV